MRKIELLIDVEESKTADQDSLTVIGEFLEDEIVVSSVVSGFSDDGNNGWQDATPEQLATLLDLAKYWADEGEFYVSDDNAIFMGNIGKGDRTKVPILFEI
jgi:hypothetical protein